MRRPLIALVPLLAAACVVEDDATATLEQPIAGCGAPFCGNTPELDGLDVLELDETRLAYSPGSGLRIKSFTSSLGHPLRLYVDGFRLYGRSLLTGAIVSPSQLTKARLVLESNTGRLFELRIDQVTTTHYYEGRDDGTAIPTYRISYLDQHDAATPRRPLCGPGQEGEAALRAVFYQGDRYDAVTADVTATGAAALPWFNVACETDARGKLLLMGYAEAAEDATHHTPVAHREAGLRAIINDVCGNGVGQTLLGTAVDWQSVEGWLVIGPDQEVEAIWNESGAVCVSNPRGDITVTGCAPPPCSAAMVGNWQQHGSWITFVPGGV